MSDSREPAVDPERPESPIGARETDHVTVEGTNTEDTIEFYRDLLGMPLVLRQPDLDRRHRTHLFFDTGDGRVLSFFVNEQRDSGDIPDSDPGQVHHLAFRIDGSRVGSSDPAGPQTWSSGRWRWAISRSAVRLVELAGERSALTWQLPSAWSAK